MNYDQAIELRVFPTFRIVHYGLNLNSVERELYERLSRGDDRLKRSIGNRETSRSCVNQVVSFECCGTRSKGRAIPGSNH